MTFADTLRSKFHSGTTLSSMSTIESPTNVEINQLSKVLSSTSLTQIYSDPFIQNENASLWNVNPLDAKDDNLLQILRTPIVQLRSAYANAMRETGAAAVVSKRTKAVRNSDSMNVSNINVSSNLLQHCQEYISANPSSASLFTPIDLAALLKQTILDTTDDGSLQMQLFSLVGAEGIELITFVMENKNDLQLQTTQDVIPSTNESYSLGTRQSGYIIQTEAQHKQAKQQRKSGRKNGRGVPKDDESNWLEAAGYDPEVLRLQKQFAEEDRIEQARLVGSSSLLQEQFGMLEGGYDTSKSAGALTNNSKRQFMLPQSAIRTRYKAYEKVFLPAATKKKTDDNVKLVPISTLEPFAQSAFEGISTLNRLQSMLFEKAYNSSQNLLVCAPTGAGKTNVAMLTILHAIKSQLHMGLQVSDIKVIYVAPMKALAQEVVYKFTNRLKDLRFNVAELTGDMQLTRKELESTQVIVTTPEKWDVITRKSTSQQLLMRQVKLLIIDEVHLLADSRGPVIETIVARTLRRVESSQRLCRIVGLSATLPNYEDVAEFLRVSPTGLFYFDGSFRPVPLDHTFIGVKSSGSAKEMKEITDMDPVALTDTVYDTEKSSRDTAKTETKAASATTAKLSKTRQVQLTMNKLVLVHCFRQVSAGNQVMVFVHSRKDTSATMRSMIEIIQTQPEDSENGLSIDAFQAPLELKQQLNSVYYERIASSRNKDLKELLQYGLGIHHAGMLRSDRLLSEELFEKGLIRVLCCTATLAWGVNLPAHSVVIKGTQVYNGDKGGFMQLSMLDVQQIFGRAGRPQYDDSGDAVILTTDDQLAHYLRLFASGIPIESALIHALPDHLNAEIVSGTVSNLEEACQWLDYTYLAVRMKKNPLAYGVTWAQQHEDPNMGKRMRELILQAVDTLTASRMIKVLQSKDKQSEGKVSFAVTSLGRVASHFYLQHQSIQTFNDLLDTHITTEEMTDTDIWEFVLLLLCSSDEFTQLVPREDEFGELERLQRKNCRFRILGGGIESCVGKTNVLLQSIIQNNSRLTSFTLVSDSNYITQNGPRVCRALFEICLKKSQGHLAEKLLTLAKCMEQQMWFDATVIAQLKRVPEDVVKEVALTHRANIFDQNTHQFYNNKARSWVNRLPIVEITSSTIRPYGRNMISLTFSLTPLFSKWDEFHFAGKSLGFWVWVEDNGDLDCSGQLTIYHSEYITISQSVFLKWKHEVATYGNSKLLEHEFFLPVFYSTLVDSSLNYVIRLLSDHFVGLDHYFDVSFTPSTQKKPNPSDLFVLPEEELRISVQAVPEINFPFEYFNFIQSHVIHQMYSTDENVLICTPVGSGDIHCAEMAIARSWGQIRRRTAGSANEHKSNVILYLTARSGLVSKRFKSWSSRFTGHKIASLDNELSKDASQVAGSFVYDLKNLLVESSFNILLLASCNGWDIFLRDKVYASQLLAKISLVILDELHLVGDTPNGAKYELQVRQLLNFATSSSMPMRIVGMTIPLSNAPDVGKWLGISTANIFNFASTSRPSKLDIHFQGFPERQYNSRMAAMNKPTFLAIQTYGGRQSKKSLSLVIVPTKAQTKLTALDLISFHSNPSSSYMASTFDSTLHSICETNVIRDDILKQTLAFGIAVFHSGLSTSDKTLVLSLAEEKIIHVIIATANSLLEPPGSSINPSVVIIKGTESFQSSHVRSYPISTMLQLIGLAGACTDRSNVPIEEKCIVCILVEEGRKNMLQRMVTEPYILDSCLHIRDDPLNYLVNELNAAINRKELKNKKQAVKFFDNTLLSIRVQTNATFYFTDVPTSAEYSGEKNISEVNVDHKQLLSNLIKTGIKQLESLKCISSTKNGMVDCTSIGQMAATSALDISTSSALATYFSSSALHNTTNNELVHQILAAICEQAVEIKTMVVVRPHELQSDWLLSMCAKVPFSPMLTQDRKQTRSWEKYGSSMKSILLVQMALMNLHFPTRDCRQEADSLLAFLQRVLGALIYVCENPVVLAGILQLKRALHVKQWPSIIDQIHQDKILFYNQKDQLRQLPIPSRCQTLLKKFLQSHQEAKKMKSLQDFQHKIMYSSTFVSELNSFLLNQDVKDQQQQWRGSEIDAMFQFVRNIPSLNVTAKLDTDTTSIHVLIVRNGDKQTKANKKGQGSKNKHDRPNGKRYNYILLLVAMTDTSIEELVTLHQIGISDSDVDVQFEMSLQGFHGNGKNFSLHCFCENVVGIDQIIEVENQ